MLLLKRILDYGSRFLDDWNLRGFLKDGAWLLRLGAETLSNRVLRATVVTHLAQIHCPEIKDVFLAYYISGGLEPFERTLDSLPSRLKAMDVRNRNCSRSSERSRANWCLDPARTKIRSTLHRETGEIVLARSTGLVQWLCLSRSMRRLLTAS